MSRTRHQPGVAALKPTVLCSARPEDGRGLLFNKVQKKTVCGGPKHGYFFVKRALSRRFHSRASEGTVSLREGLRKELNACAPRLRRYARALATGNPAASSLADDLVQAALMRALGARQLGTAADLPIRLYATVTHLHRETCAQTACGVRPALIAGTLAPALARQTRLSAALLSLPLDEREALLLVALEGFDHGEAARILRISRTILLSRLTRARRALDVGLAVPSQQQAPRSNATRPRAHLRLVT